MAARRKLAHAFSTEPETTGYQTSIFKQILSEAGDPDCNAIPDWLEFGFPLGINDQIVNNGIFPETDSVSASIKASQALGILLEDWDGSAKNYKSYEEVGANGQAELDRLKLTKLACIIKQKKSAEKVRLVVDMRRSGVNGLMMLRERVILPRVSDVAESVHALFLKNGRRSNVDSSSVTSRMCFTHSHSGRLNASLQWLRDTIPHFI